MLYIWVIQGRLSMLQRWCCPEKLHPSWTSHSLIVEPAQCLSRHWVTDSVFGRDIRQQTDGNSLDPIDAG
jgi:hypothetical protein